MNVNSDYTQPKPFPEIPYRFSRKLSTTKSTELTEFLFKPSLFEAMLEPFDLFLKFADAHTYENHAYA